MTTTKTLTCNACGYVENFGDNITWEKATTWPEPTRYRCPKCESSSTSYTSSVGTENDHNSHTVMLDTYGGAFEGYNIGLGKNIQNKGDYREMVKKSGVAIDPKNPMYGQF